jgi:competence protein ComEC
MGELGGAGRPAKERRRPVRRPLCWAACGLLAGQAIAAVLPGRLPPVGIGLTLGTYWVGRRAGISLPAIALLAAVLGHRQLDGLLQPRLGEAHVRQLAGRAVELEARLAERPALRDSGTRFLLDVVAVREGDGLRSAYGRVLVTVRAVAQRWRRGDRLRARVRLRLPRNFGNPGEFDYEAFLARQAVYVTGFAEDDRDWSVVEAAGGFAAALERWRDDVGAAIDSALDEPERSIVAALLIGESGALARPIRDRYAATGTSHILSISGLHVGLVAMASHRAALWLLARSEWLLLAANVPKVSMALAVVPVLAYVEIAGSSAPTVRSAVMVLLLLVATLIDRRRDWWTTMATAAFAINLAWPGSLFDVSFQLSFASVIAIVLGMSRLTEWWNRWEEAHLVRLRARAWTAVRWAVLYEGVTLCAVAGTAPLGAWHFNRVSLVAALANPVVVPLLGFVPVGLGLVAIFVRPLSPEPARLLLLATGAIVHFADRLVELLAALPGASVRVPTPTRLELLLVYGALGSALVRSRRWRRAVGAVCLAALAVDGAYWWARRFHRRDLEVTFLSVGQGDSAVVEFPGSQVMVVDGGGLSPTFDPGERIIAPYLWSRKIGRIDVLALSHAEYDHYGGLGFLASDFGAGALWWNGRSGHGIRFAEFWDAVGRGGVRPIAVRRGFRRRIGGVEVRAVAPGEDTLSSANDGSLALQLRYGPASLLFTGDLEAAGEERLVQALGIELRSTLLKVPHHGSRTSSSAPLLAAAAPCIAVISAGFENRFAMPHAPVLDAYRARGTRVFRTDRDGAVNVRIDENGRVEVRTGASGTSERWDARFCS